MRRNSKGFTLVELIVVILILGILAATAAPKFINLTGNARAAALGGLQAAVISSATLANALQQASGLTPNQSVTIEGSTVTMSNGYPDQTGIWSAVRFDTTTFSTQASGVFRVTAGTSPNCQFTYNAAAANSAPTITGLTTTGC